MQGILEWIPVSSSGQLSLILTGILGVSPNLAYRLSLAAHLGTSLSGAIVLKDEILRIPTDRKILEVAILPVFIGAPIALIIEKYVSGLQGDIFNLLIGIMLLATALLLYIGGTKTGLRKFQEINYIDLILLGLAQGVSAIPGLSRSGITITILLLRRMEPYSAVKASFLTGIFATGVAALYEIASGGTLLTIKPATLLFVSALLAGTLSAKIMLTLSQKYNKQIMIFVAIIGILAILSAIPLVL